MEYRSLGRTGVQVSSLCLGCMNFPEGAPEAEAMDIIDYAIETGINFIDTANVYSYGGSEEVLGRALQRNKQRHRIVLATKVYGKMDEQDPNARGTSRRHIIEQCEASLRRLQTDYIDLYQIHRPLSTVPIDETLRALDDLVRSGKVRYIGTSTYPAWKVLEALWASKEYGLNRFISEQPPYHLLDRQIEAEIIPMAQTYGIAIIPWSPLAGGFLTGKYRRETEQPEGSRFKRGWFGIDRHLSEPAFAVLDVAEAIAQEKGCTVSQFALAWCASQPGITSPIVGPRSLDQLKDNLGALTVQVNDEDRTRIDAVSPPKRFVVQYYGAFPIDDHGPNTIRW
jgi:aryl-alcohol dehydrogenase-like predicted oxidoreductase